MVFGINVRKVAGFFTILKTIDIRRSTTIEGLALFTR